MYKYGILSFKYVKQYELKYKIICIKFMWVMDVKVLAPEFNI